MCRRLVFGVPPSPPPAPARRPPLAADLGMFLVALIWGVNFSVTKGAFDRFAPLAFRGDRGLRVELVATGGRRATVHRDARPTVRLIGPPMELLLYAYGRRGAALVEVEGDGEAIGRLRALELRA